MWKNTVKPAGRSFDLTMSFRWQKQYHFLPPVRAFRILLHPLLWPNLFLAQSRNDPSYCQDAYSMSSGASMIPRIHSLRTSESLTYVVFTLFISPSHQLMSTGFRWYRYQGPNRLKDHALHCRLAWTSSNTEKAVPYVGSRRWLEMAICHQGTCEMV